jgi:capsular polysaccharide biosynthesis protein
MQEEISLREILETIWNGKLIIIAVTIIAVLVSAIFSFFVIEPTYEAKAQVRLDGSLNTVTESIKSDVAMNRIINKLNLNRDQYNINNIRDSIQLAPIEDTNIIEIKVEGTNPRTITKIANMMTFEIAARTEITDRSTKIIGAQNKLLELKDSLAMVETELSEANKQLAETPEKLINKKTLADEPYMQSVAQENSPRSNKELGAMELISESTNPVYLSLKQRIVDGTISQVKLIEEKQINEVKIAENQGFINQLENHIENERLSVQNSQRLFSGFSAVFISPALEPSEPIGPKKVLNIAIAAVVGVMLSVMIVFVSNYWHNSSTPASSSGNEISM